MLAASALLLHQSVQAKMRTLGAEVVDAASRRMGYWHSRFRQSAASSRTIAGRPDDLLARLTTGNAAAIIQHSVTRLGGVGIPTRSSRKVQCAPAHRLAGGAYTEKVETADTKG